MGYKNPEQRKAYAREWMAKRRAAYFSDKSCVACGSTNNLELDHVVPSEKTSHAIWSWRQETREAELAKCQVLCRDCHLAKTSADRKATPAHGTRSRYNNHGCRCDPCTEAQARYLSEYRRRREAMPAA